MRAIGILCSLYDSSSDYRHATSNLMTSDYGPIAAIPRSARIIHHPLTKRHEEPDSDSILTLKVML